MKKIVVGCILCVMMVPLFAQTYEEGYAQGYADALAGLPNMLETQQAPEPQGMGMWALGDYVDNFGDPTGRYYVTPEEWVYGTFSNSATQNADLKVDFLIGYTVENDPYFAVALYEYGNKLVTGSSNYPTEYAVSIKSDHGTLTDLPALNGSTRLYLSNRDSAAVIDLMNKGGMVKFYIYQIDRPIVQYRFDIMDSAGLDVALAAL